MNKRQRKKLLKEGAVFKVIKKFPISNAFETGNVIQYTGGGFSEKIVLCKKLDNELETYLIHICQLKPLYLKEEKDQLKVAANS